jgi:hypothetical protein
MHYKTAAVIIENNHNNDMNIIMYIIPKILLEVSNQIGYGTFGEIGKV